MRAASFAIQTLPVAALVAATAMLGVPCAFSADSLPEGASTLQESYQDWQLRCARQEETVHCAISQILTEVGTGKRAVAIELQAGADGAVRGHVLLPFGLALADGVRLSINDEGLGPTLPFSTCLPSGCAVPLAFDPEEVAVLQTSEVLMVTATALADGEDVSFDISLNGFSQAIERSAELGAP